MSNFVYDGDVIDPKREIDPVPGGAGDVYFGAVDFNNTIKPALEDLRSSVIDGAMFGMDPQVVAPGGAVVDASLYYLWVRDADKHLIYQDNGVSIDLSALAGGGISGALNAPRIPVASGAATVVNSNFTAVGNTFDLTAAGTMTLGGTATDVALAAGVSLSGVAGAGGLELDLMTGDSLLPTGSLSWLGAAAKTLAFVGTSTLTLTAGAASTWDTFDGTVKAALITPTSAGTALSLLAANGPVDNSGGALVLSAGQAGAFGVSGAPGSLVIISATDGSGGNAGGSIDIVAGRAAGGALNAGAADGGSISLTAGSASSEATHFGNADGGDINLTAGTRGTFGEVGGSYGHINIKTYETAGITGVVNVFDAVDVLKFSINANGSITFGDLTTQSTAGVTAAALTVGRIPVATGATTLANSNFTAAGNTFDLAAAATMTIGGAATAILAQANAITLKGTNAANASVPVTVDATNVQTGINRVFLVNNAANGPVFAVDGNATLYAGAGDSAIKAGALDRQTAGTLSIAAGAATGLNLGSATAMGTIQALAQSFQVLQSTLTAGNIGGFYYAGGPHTGLTAGAEYIDFNLNANRTVQFSTGAIATQRMALIQAPTYAFVGASIITTAVTLDVTGPPIAGANATITNAFAIRSGGAVQVNSTAFANAFQAQTASGFDMNGASTLNIGTVNANAIVAGRAGTVTGLLQAKSVSLKGTDAANGVTPIVFDTTNAYTAQSAIASFRTGGVQKAAIDASGSIYVTAGQQVDTLAAGALQLGVSTATSITAGRAGASFNINSDFTLMTGFQILSAAAATAGATLKNTPNLYFRATYWNGAASTNYDMSIRGVMDSTTPTAHLALDANVTNLTYESTANGAGPAFTTRSTGEKVTLYPAITGATANFAIGVDNAVAFSTWFGVPTTGYKFQFFGGTTEALRVSGLGAVSMVAGSALDVLTAGTLTIGGTITTLTQTASTGVTFNTPQVVANADGTRDLGLVGTRWRTVAGLRFINGTQNIAFSATPAFDPTLGNVIHMQAVTANITAATMTGGAAGETCTIIFLKNVSATAFTITFSGTNVRTAGVLTFTTGNSSLVSISFAWDDRLATPAWVEIGRTAFN